MYKAIIVDDNKREQRLISNIVDESKLDIDIIAVYSNGMQVLENIDEQVPDIILSDIFMPIMDGIEMMRKIREKYNDIEVILFSCYDEFEFAKAAVSLNIFSYVLKPVVNEDVIMILKKLVKELDKNRESEIKKSILEERLRESLPILRENFIKELVFGKYYDLDDIKQNMKYLNIELPENYLIRMMVLSIDYSSSNKVDKQYLNILKIRDIIGSLDKQKGTFLRFQFSVNSFTIVEIIDLQKTDKHYDLDTLYKLYTTINDELSLDIKAGISKSTRYFSDLSNLYKQCNMAIDSNFYDIYERFVLYEDIEAEEDHSLDRKIDFGELYGELLKIFDETGDSLDETIEAFLDKYLNKNIRHENNYINGLIYSVFSFIKIIEDKIVLDYESIIDNDKPVWKDIDNLKSLNEIRKWLKEYIKECYKNSKPHHSGLYFKIVEDIKKVIKEKHGTQLGMKEISNILGYSPNHLNNIFKKETGRTIFDYLTEYRIEKAKEYLRDSYMRIYEIAEKVGYSNNSHFSYQFKKITGMTPGKFRNI